MCAWIAAACASAPTGERARVAWTEVWPELVAEDASELAAAREARRFPARRPARDELARLVELENAYRRGDDAGFAALCAAIADRPVPSFWLARMLIREVLGARDRGIDGERALVTVPPWQRPADLLVAMGAAAAPCIVVDLLGNPHADRRELGAELLARLGPDALPAWIRAHSVDDTRVRRKALEVVSSWEPLPPLAETSLLDATRDADFGVRAAAFTALGRAGRAQSARLVAALASEPDPFVQRAIASSLVAMPSRDAAQAVVAFLERSTMAGDVESADLADEVLRRMSGRGERTALATWRQWADALPVDG